MSIGYVRVSTSTGYEVRIFLLPGHVQILLNLIAGLPFLPYAKMFVCERCRTWTWLEMRKEP